MTSVVEIGSLIDRDPAIRGGRPKIAGTGMTVRCIAGWYKLGMTAEEIALDYPHISLAQVHAALTYYHANREEIEADLAAEEAAEIEWRQRLTKTSVSRLSLYLDEDTMSWALIYALRSRGIDVISVRDAGTVRWPDREQLAFASAHNRGIYSFNVGDYCSLHQEWIETGREHTGIILAPQRLTVGEELRRLMRLISGISAEGMRSRLEFLSAWR